mgnify:CR=1 FL=1
MDEPASLSSVPFRSMMAEELRHGYQMLHLLIDDDWGSVAQVEGAEMVEDGRTGLHFRAGDSKSLADRILRMHKEPELRSTLGASAKRKALVTFDVKQHAEGVQAVYDHIFS